jgi:hypothetical protein
VIQPPNLTKMNQPRDPEDSTYGPTVYGPTLWRNALAEAERHDSMPHLYPRHSARPLRPPGAGGAGGVTDRPDAAALAPAWRERAASIRRYAPEVANAWEDAATELETTLRDIGADLLSLQAAARESGYSPDHLGRLIRRGKLTNHGREHAPKVRRAELPRKPVTARRLAPGPKGPNMEALTRDAIASTRRSA